MINYVHMINCIISMTLSHELQTSSSSCWHFVFEGELFVQGFLAAQMSDEDV